MRPLSERLAILILATASIVSFIIFCVRVSKIGAKVAPKIEKSVAARQWEYDVVIQYRSGMDENDTNINRWFSPYVVPIPHHLYSNEWELVAVVPVQEKGGSTERLHFYYKHSRE